MAAGQRQLERLVESVVRARVAAARADAPERDEAVIRVIGSAPCARTFDACVAPVVPAAAVRHARARATSASTTSSARVPLQRRRTRADSARRARARTSRRDPSRASLSTLTPLEPRGPPLGRSRGFAATAARRLDLAGHHQRGADHVQPVRERVVVAERLGSGDRLLAPGDAFGVVAVEHAGVGLVRICASRARVRAEASRAARSPSGSRPRPRHCARRGGTESSARDITPPPRACHPARGRARSPRAGRRSTRCTGRSLGLLAVGRQERCSLRCRQRSPACRSARAYWAAASRACRAAAACCAAAGAYSSTAAESPASSAWWASRETSPLAFERAHDRSVQRPAPVGRDRTLDGEPRELVSEREPSPSARRRPTRGTRRSASSSSGATASSSRSSARRHDRDDVEQPSRRSRRAARPARAPRRARSPGAPLRGGREDLGDVEGVAVSEPVESRRRPRPSGVGERAHGVEREPRHGQAGDRRRRRELAQDDSQRMVSGRPRRRGTSRRRARA